MKNLELEIEKFIEVIKSLKLQGRSDLNEQLDLAFLIKPTDIHVDLRDYKHTDWLNPSKKSIISDLMKNKFSFIVRRKGIGKSTLFQVLQDIFRRKWIEIPNTSINSLNIYINAFKTFDKSKENYSLELSETELTRRKVHYIFTQFGLS